VKYQHTDALGTPIAVTDAAKAIVQKSEYEPYGQLVNRPLTDGPGFTGHVQDAATGLTYMQQRYYDPLLGRFLSVDPVTAYSSPGANFNRYWYASNNPYRYYDPDGRKPKDKEDEEKCRTMECNRERQDERRKKRDEPFTGGGLRTAAVRTIDGILGVGQVVGGGGQVATGAKFCTAAWGAGCLVGVFFVAHGAANIADGVGNAANAIDGRNREWNFLVPAYSKLTKSVFGGDYGRQGFLVVDTVMGGTALLRTTRRYYNPNTPTITGWATRSEAGWSPVGVVANDLAQQAKTLEEELSK